MQQSADDSMREKIALFGPASGISFTSLSASLFNANKRDQLLVISAHEGEAFNSSFS
ncbi:hypothetical protein [Planctomicrobium piriforme]|uniref:hypothetical protein n=1 Tax=Planctomicrobium piriforme TaxID=1576369 RepID=UPI0015873AE5|nr:hypothetical protein [Planctomicrobium piriforme]